MTSSRNEEELDECNADDAIDQEIEG